MSVIKHDFPILEYDTDPIAAFSPTHEELHLKLPRKAVFAFLGEYIDRYAQDCGATQVAKFLSATKHYPIYTMMYRGEQLCLCQAPVGAPAAVQLMDWLIGYGVCEIISAGSCGVLTDEPENIFLVPCRALRDEGTSYHYLPPSRFVTVDTRARAAIQKTMLDNALDYREVTTWSTDGFFRETKQMVVYRRQEGCSVVEMECAALAACAQMRGIVWGEILFTADTLANIDRYDERNWGNSSLEYALRLCLDTVCNIKS